MPKEGEAMSEQPQQSAILGMLSSGPTDTPEVTAEKTALLMVYSDVLVKRLVDSKYEPTKEWLDATLEKNRERLRMVREKCSPDTTDKELSKMLFSGMFDELKRVKP